jgi:hypothetical protein
MRTLKEIFNVIISLAAIIAVAVVLLFSLVSL